MQRGAIIRQAHLSVLLVSVGICAVRVGCTGSGSNDLPNTAPRAVDCDTGEPALSDQDSDRDDAVDSRDNCPSQFNPDQDDRDLESVGDLCDGNPGYAME